MGLGLAETDTKAELSRIGLELALILSLEDFPGGWGWVEQKWKYSSAQLKSELGNISLLLKYINVVEIF